jgi:hypothetical protein
LSFRFALRSSLFLPFSLAVSLKHLHFFRNSGQVDFYWPIPMLSFNLAQNRLTSIRGGLLNTLRGQLQIGFYFLFFLFEVEVSSRWDGMLRCLALLIVELRGGMFLFFTCHIGGTCLLHFFFLGLRP